MSVALCTSRLPLITRSPWVSWRLGSVKASYTDGPACLTCKKSGSTPDRPSNSTRYTRMPTLPTPTTWRTVSVSVKRSNRTRLSSCRVSRYPANSWPTSLACSASLIVTLTGGSSVIRGRPLAICVSLANAPAVVPDVKLGPRGVRAHATAVGVEARSHRVGRRTRREAGVPRRHDEAGSETLDVPFERPGQGLVKIAHVERQVAFRGGPQAEVQHVRVTAQLHRQPAVGL